MVWYIIAGIAAAIAILLLVYTFVRDRRYERKRVLDAMSPDLRAEIEAEREEGFKRRERFQEALGDAMDREVEKDSPPHDAVP
jgi:hypothetical protein